MNLELPYIAAFLDCDGTIVITRMRRRRAELHDSFTGVVQFYSQNRPVLEMIQVAIGGKIPPPNRTNLVWTLRLRKQEAINAMTMLLPYLQIKRDQALLFLRFYQHIGSTVRVGKKGKGGGGQMHLSEAIYAERLAMCAEIKILNKKDPKQFRIDRSNWVNSAKPSVKRQRRAEPQRAVGSAEGVTASSPSPNGNESQERPALSIVSRREDIA